MNAESPFDAALKQDDILAREIEADARLLNLPQATAADIFHRRNNGSPRCEYPHNDAQQPNPPPCPDDAEFLVTNCSGSTVDDAFAEPTAPSRMTRALRQKHAAESAVTHQGWLHSLPLDSADEFTAHHVLQLQLARRLMRNFHSNQPVPYPSPDPFANAHDSTPPSVERLRHIQSKITFLLRPSRLCAAPLCYEDTRQPNTTA